MPLTNVIEGVYKGVSPALLEKNGAEEERLFLELPDNLTDQEILMAFALVNKSNHVIDANAPIKNDFDKKREEIDGKTYMRCGPGSIDEEVQKFQISFTKAVQYIRENSLTEETVQEMTEGKKEYPNL